MAGLLAAVRLPGSGRLARVAAHQGPDDAGLVEALRRGDEAAFVALVDRHQEALLLIARRYLADRAVAEEVVQETWLAVLEGIDRFEGRASVKTWLYRILINRATSRARREHRQLPFSALGGEDEPEVDPDRFLPLGASRSPIQWAVPPRAWPDERLEAAETIAAIRAALQQLPLAQQVIVGLRDVEGWSAEEVCAALQINDGNQRVLLHRARSALRRQLEHYFQDP